MKKQYNDRHEKGYEMTRISDKSIKEVEKIIEILQNILILWRNEKKTGKFSIEINMNQGGITQCYCLTKSEVK